MAELAEALVASYPAGAGAFDTPTAITRPDGVTIRRAYSSDGEG